MSADIDIYTYIYNVSIGVYTHILIWARRWGELRQGGRRGHGAGQLWAEEG